MVRNVRSSPRAAACSAWRLMAWRASAKRLTTTSMRSSRCGGIGRVEPVAAPEVARANSRIRLSTCALASSSSSVGTSPSDTTTVCAPGLSSTSSAHASIRTSTSTSVSSSAVASPSSAQTTLPVSAGSHPQWLARAETSASPRPVIASGFAAGRTGRRSPPSATSMRTPDGDARRVTRMGGAPCRTALVASSATTSSASSVKCLTAGSARLERTK